ncbi:MAG: flagellar motor protein MotB [Gemmatimonadota bacterium]
MKTDREQPIIIIRKIVKKGGGHHGGAWKVAFADFMTAMMALFLVLWLVTQSSEIRSSIAGYFQDPLGRSNESGASMIPGEGQPMTPTRAQIQAKPADGRHDELLQLSQQIKESLPDSLASAGLSQHVVIEVTDEGLRISLLEDSTDVFFASGSATLFPKAQQLFTSIGTVLERVGYPVIIEGHTDSHPFAAGKGYTNWELSADRANSARRALILGGYDGEKVTAVRGLADREPRIPTDPSAPQNRRVTILVQVPKVGEIPAATTTAPKPDSQAAGRRPE